MCQLVRSLSTRIDTSTLPQHSKTLLGHSCCHSSKLSAFCDHSSTGSRFRYQRLIDLQYRSCERYMLHAYFPRETRGDPISYTRVNSCLHTDILHATHTRDYTQVECTCAITIWAWSNSLNVRLSRHSKGSTESFKKLT